MSDVLAEFRHQGDDQSRLQSTISWIPAHVDEHGVVWVAQNGEWVLAEEVQLGVKKYGVQTFTGRVQSVGSK
jgi:hypothetical protein